MAGFEMLSNHSVGELPDWSREDKTLFSWSPGRSLIASIRAYQKHNCSNGFVSRLILRKIATLRYRIWSIVTGADIPLNCNIAGGLLIPHPNGIVIHPDVKIGPNCLIFQQVTIGSRGEGRPPIIGTHVDIGRALKY
jgi:serine O-acetyltransferase